jgi:pimeloyl-ACP methyl ester carboxylesterase
MPGSDDLAPQTPALALANGHLTRRRVLAGVAALAAAGTSAGWWTFDRALRRAEHRVTGVSEVIRTRFGNLEYAMRGSGPPILMIHGTGGGFDQGLDMSAPLIAKGYRVIAPSRFGYLRSDFPENPSSESQADALAELLDRLGIARVAVAGGSAGALSAIQFALRHPDRCSALVLLVPAANAQGRDPVEMTAAQKFLVEHVLGSDVLFWTIRQLAPGTLVGTLLATDPALLDQVPTSERDRAFRILDDMLPVSRRRRGLRNDALLASAPHPVAYEAIKAPTLLLSLEDDRFGTAVTARYLATRISNAELVILPRGGHVWLGAEDQVFGHVHRFLKRVGIER